MRDLKSFLVSRYVEGVLPRALGGEDQSDVMGPDVVVSGFFSRPLGLGVAANFFADALEARGFQVHRHDFQAIDWRKIGGNELPGPPGAIWFCLMNPPEAAYLLSRLSVTTLRSRFKVGYWVWELEVVPRRWPRLGQLFDRVVAPSSFSADALSPWQPVDVLSYGLTISMPAQKATVPGVCKTVLCQGDGNSSIDRKNVTAAIRAFRRLKTRAVRLVVKTQNLTGGEYDRISAEIGGDQQIDWIGETLSGGDMRGLYDRSDLFLSPHRAEGFGVDLFRFLMAGKRVVCSRYGAPVEFLSEDEASLVGGQMLRIPLTDRVYGEYAASGATWFDPDEYELSACLDVNLSTTGFDPAMVYSVLSGYESAWAKVEPGVCLSDLLAG